MQEHHREKIVLTLFVLGLLGFASSQLIDQDPASSDFDFMIGTKEPEDEVVPIHKSQIQKRSVNGPFHLTFKAFGEHIKLWLEPNDGVLVTSQTPIFTIDAKGEITEIPSLMRLYAQYLYHNEKEAATMVITETSDGHYKLNGVIGGRRIAIRSTQDPSQNKNQSWFQTKRFKRFIENTPEHELGNYTYHIVSKLPEVPEHFKTLKPPTLKFVKSKRSVAPEVIYPEIMVVADYSLFQKFGLSHYNLVKYILAFWNSVDFKYRSLEHPRYRLNIAGIMIATKPTSLSFMQHKLKFYPYDLMIQNALHDSADFVLKIEKQFSTKYSFDALVTMTSTKVCTIEGRRCERGTIGLAYASGACRLPKMVLHQGKKIPINSFKSSIVYDQAGYDGVNVAAHELGHLLGAKHDGEHNEKCSLDIGNLMAPMISYTANSSDWSSCTVRDMQNFLNSQSSECLFNEPQREVRLARFLPGKILNADEQCRAYGRKRAYEFNKNICLHLQCLNDQETIFRNFPGAADGTVCGDNKICLHRQCIDLSKISI